MISILSLVILNDKGLRVQCSLSTSKNIVTSHLFWCIYIILILYMYLVKAKKTDRERNLSESKNLYNFIELCI